MSHAHVVNEKGLLGCALQDPAILDDCRVTRAQFLGGAYADLWGLLQALRHDARASQHDPADGWLERVYDAVRAQPGAGKSNLVLGVADTLHLATMAPSSEAWRYHAARIRENAATREVMYACELAIGRIKAAEPLAGIAADLATAAERATEADPLKHAGWVRLGDTMRAVVEAASSTVIDTGHVPLGIPSLDAQLGGMRAGDMIILGARPSMGKTALAVQIAEAVARSGRTVAMFEMEMTREALAHRAAASAAGVSIHDLRGGCLSAHAARRAMEAAEEHALLPLYVDDACGLATHEIASRARRAATLDPAHPLGLIVIDYVQLAKAALRHGEGRERVVAEISMAIKSLARSLRVPVLALAQLSRKAEDRSDGRPALGDLRDSGQLEQDADAVLLLHREVRVNPKCDDPDAAEIIIAKQRQGPTGVINLRFDGDTQRFRDPPPGFASPDSGYRRTERSWND